MNELTRDQLDSYFDSTKTVKCIFCTNGIMGAISTPDETGADVMLFQFECHSCYRRIIIGYVEDNRSNLFFPERMYEYIESGVDGDNHHFPVYTNVKWWYNNKGVIPRKVVLESPMQPRTIEDYAKGYIKAKGVHIEVQKPILDMAKSRLTAQTQPPFSSNIWSQTIDQNSVTVGLLPSIRLLLRFCMLKWSNRNNPGVHWRKNLFDSRFRDKHKDRVYMIEMNHGGKTHLTNEQICDSFYSIKTVNCMFCINGIMDADNWEEDHHLIIFEATCGSCYRTISIEYVDESEDMYTLQTTCEYIRDEEDENDELSDDGHHTPIEGHVLWWFNERGLIPRSVINPVQQPASQTIEEYAVSYLKNNGVYLSLQQQGILSMVKDEVGEPVTSETWTQTVSDDTTIAIVTICLSIRKCAIQWSDKHSPLISWQSNFVEPSPYPC